MKPLFPFFLIAFIAILAVLRKANITKNDNTASSEPVLKITNNLNLAKPVGQTDTSELKQSGWYASAMGNLVKAEYNIHQVENANTFSSPNRHNNLRFYYDENGFSVQPRTTKIPVGRVEAETMPEKTAYKTLPDWKVTFNLSKKQIGEGSWRVNDNKAEYITNNVTVQYINNEDGMRQNFIVQKPLTTGDELNIHFSVETELQQRFSPNRLQFVSKKTGVVLSYEQLKVWDANGQPLEAAFEKNKQDYCIHVNAKNAVYPVTIDPLSSTPAIRLESNQANAYFGCSVAGAGDVNGDGYSDVIVGAYNYDNGQTDEGAAFIYHGSSTGIKSTAAAIIEVNVNTARLGFSVAGAGDVNGDGYSDVIVGAYNYNNGNPGEGAAFIYHGSATGINATTPAVIIESNQNNAFMGYAVAGAGDVNGDGYSDVIIGAYMYDHGQAEEGAAFIYLGSSTGISATAATVLENNKANSYLGSRVAGAGDVNGDGYNDVIVGAIQYSNNEAGEGAVYVYHGSATGINATAVFSFESNQVGAGMGRVSCAGDINGDGYSDVIIGAQAYDKGQPDEGVVFVFHGSATGIVPAAAAVLEINQATAAFGNGVSSGDVNGDGYSDILVGASLYDNNNTNEGGVFVYRGSATGINTTAYKILEGNQDNDQFGASVASAGDVNGDGYTDIIVGASSYDNGQPDEGAAFVFHGSASNIDAAADAVFSNVPAGSNLGVSLACAGDINGDGYSDIIAGASRYENGTNLEGAAFIYYGSINGISATPNVILENNRQNNLLGTSVAGAGDVNGDGYGDVIVGAPGAATNDGEAFIYHGSATGLNTTVATRIQNYKNLAYMGCSVACAGDVNGDGYSDVIVGAYGYANGDLNEGAAFIYHGSATGIKTTAAAVVESNQAGANMGYSVGGAGDVNGDGYSDVIVGAYQYDDDQTDEGVAYVYYGSATGIVTATYNMLECDQVARFGWSVAGAGDLNGDGYADVIVGAPSYSNGETNEGAAFVFHGSATGIRTTAAARLENNRGGSYLGQRVDRAGDVDGDGYSDVIVGAPNHSNGQANEGAAFIFKGSATGIYTAVGNWYESNREYSYMGNAAGAGDINGDGFSDVMGGAIRYGAGGAVLVFYSNTGISKRSNLSLYNADLTTPVNKSNFPEASFGAGLFAKSFLGGQIKGKLVWETRLNYNKYSGTPITNSVLFTSSQSGYTNLGIAGTELKSLVAKLTGGRYVKIRARVKYDPVTAITGQLYGPWRYVPEFVSGASLGVLPVDLISFKAEWIEKGRTAQLKFVTDNESDVNFYEVQRSTDGVNYTTIGTVTAKNTGRQTSYSYIDNDASGKKLYYRLKTSFNSSASEYSNIQMLQTNVAIEVIVFPNPAKDVIQLRLNNSYAAMNVKIINSAGQTIKQLNNISTAGEVISIPVSDLHTGVYFLYLQSGHEKQVMQFVKA